MNKRFLNRLINICLVLGLMFTFFGTVSLVALACGVILLALVAFVLIPCHQNAPMPRDIRIERRIHQKRVEQREHLGLKMSVRPNYFKGMWRKILLKLFNRKRDVLCLVAVR